MINRDQQSATGNRKSIKVGLFVTCLVDQLWSSIGTSTVEVLRRAESTGVFESPLFTPEERSYLECHVESVELYDSLQKNATEHADFREFTTLRMVDATRAQFDDSTSANDSTSSFDTSRRNTQPSDSPIGNASAARAAARLSISPYEQ